MIAKSVDDLHSDKNNLTKETQLTEKGTVVNGRGDTPNMHDILTGSGLDGRAVAGGDDTTCNNWTSDDDRQRAWSGTTIARAAAPTRRRGTPRTRRRAAARRTWWAPAATASSTASPATDAANGPARPPAPRPRCYRRVNVSTSAASVTSSVTSRPSRPAVALLAAARAAVGARQQVAQRGAVQRVPLGQPVARAELEERRVLLDHGVGAIPRGALALHQRAQLDQVVRRRHGDEQAAAGRQDAARIPPGCGARSATAPGPRAPSSRGRRRSALATTQVSAGVAPRGARRSRRRRCRCRCRRRR